MKNPYQAYQKATRTVSKTRQVVMLYEGILRNLQQAREAIERKDIQERYNKLMRAGEIVVGLQMSLDFDSGQEAAQALYDFYALLDKRIMQLQRSQSLDLCDALIDEVRGMLEVWVKIDRGELNAVHGAEVSMATPPASQGEKDAAPEALETKVSPISDPITFSA